MFLRCLFIFLDTFYLADAMIVQLRRGIFNKLLTDI